MTEDRNSDSERLIRFGRMTLDLRRGRLLRGADDVPMRAKTWAVLCYLAERPGCLVGKDELLAAVWPDVVVTEETLSKSIAEIRRALDENPGAPRFLKTVHGRGFCLLGGDADGRGSRPPEADDDSGRALAPDRLLVGRADELAELARCWQEALAGQRQLVFVTGEPGIGKTALVEAFLAAAPAHTPGRRSGWGAATPSSSTARANRICRYSMRSVISPVSRARRNYPGCCGAGRRPGLPTCRGCWESEARRGCPPPRTCARSACCASWLSWSRRSAPSRR